MQKNGQGLLSSHVPDEGVRPYVFYTGVESYDRQHSHQTPGRER